MKILVTGGLGFIGSALVRLILDESNDEVLKDRLQTAIDKGLLINVEDGSEDEAKANPTFEFNAKSEAEARARA